MFATFLRAALCVAPSDDCFPTNLILNSGFELVADSTTTPPKYGSYWEQAFVPKEGDPTCRVVEDAQGNRVLKLHGGEPAVAQTLTLLGPASNRLVVTFRARIDGAEDRLSLRFASEGGRSLSFSSGGESGGGDPESATLPFPEGASDRDGFTYYRFEIGNQFASRFGASPPAWGRIELSATGGEIEVDDVVAAHWLPRVTHADLRRMLQDDVRDILAIHLGQPGGGEGAVGKGLGVVDLESGYQVVGNFDVETGEVLQRDVVVGIKGIHEILLRYVRSRDDSGGSDPLRALARETLHRHAQSLLKNNIYAPTGLYCLYDISGRRPVEDGEVSPSHFIEHVLDVSDVFPEDKVLRRYAVFYCQRMADALVAMRIAHDLPKDVPFGRGASGNWFGRLPDIVSPRGVIPPPKKATYDQSWAIALNRSWYYDFDCTTGLMRVHGVAPSPAYVEAVRSVCAKFDRKFDAQRYDLENDTDDHYGHNVESALRAYRNCNGEMKELLHFAQKATDHRLSREAPIGESIWIQGIRLGSFTTGDQQRAYCGPVELHDLSPEMNPETSGFAPYVDAIRELTKAELRRRLLDDGYLTEASSWQWRMHDHCFKGDYIAPCEQGLDWEGDMGDLFAGPPANTFLAYLRAIEIDRPGPDRENVAWYAALHAHVLSRYRTAYGYRVGLPIETGLRYGVRTKDLLGWDSKNPYGLAITMRHAILLETGKLDVEPASVAIREVKRDPDDPTRAVVAIEGPAGRDVSVFTAAAARFEDAGPSDWRLRHVSRREGEFAVARARLADDGTATLPIEVSAWHSIAVDVELPMADGTGLEDLAGGTFALEE